MNYVYGVLAAAAAVVALVSARYHFLPGAVGGVILSSYLIHISTKDWRDEYRRKW